VKPCCYDGHGEDNDNRDVDDVGVDIDGADGGNIGCRLMPNQPGNDDIFTDLIVNGTVSVLFLDVFQSARLTFWIFILWTKYLVSYAAVTSTIRLRFDGRSTVLRLLIEGH